MKNIVNLKELAFNKVLDIYNTDDFYMTETKSKISIDNFKKSYEYYLRHNLRYNQKQGKVLSSNEGVLSEYSYKKDIPNYTNIIDVIKNELLNIIICGASRLQRGYSL